MGFTLRAIDDKRAIPALIRAIPKTLIRRGSDMGLSTQDEELLAFGQQHDLKEQDRGNDYGFGRPVREIFGALHKISDQDFDDSQLYSVFLSGTEGQRQRKRDLFERQAARWANWWEAHAENADVPAEFRRVNLPAYEPLPPQRVDLGIDYKTDSGGFNCMLEMIQADDPRTVFFDIDTSRKAGLPKKWQNVPKEDLSVDELARWGRSEGFDMMGTQYDIGDGETCYAIRLLGTRAMQLPANRWKMRADRITLEALIDEGTPIGEYLFHHDGDEIDVRTHAPFFVVTAEETPALLYLGIEVRDDNLKPGIAMRGDHELHPVAFRKGRRYAYRLFSPADDDPNP
ncbi:MAG: hypothetical protein HKN47_21070 [Pirellulaceae bacterium]|nr:hypothetical protein [Pirellulaceae bacterium]